MSIEIKRQNFVAKAQKYFAFLTKDHSCRYKGHSKSDWTDELHYENIAIDRLIVLSNQYHPNGYGFEVQLYRPSISTVHSEREFQTCKQKEDQDDEQEYLSDLALQFRNRYASVIIGDDWVTSKNENNESPIGNFGRELEKVQNGKVLSPGFHKKKLIIWCIRTSIALILYAVFWKYAWVRWTLLMYIPLSLFSLLSLYGWTYSLKKKIGKTNLKISEAEDAIRETETE